MSQEKMFDVLIFKPNYEEFSDFSKYIEYMESKGAHLSGMAKVITDKKEARIIRYMINNRYKILHKLNFVPLNCI